MLGSSRGWALCRPLGAQWGARARRFAAARQRPPLPPGAVLDHSPGDTKKFFIDGAWAAPLGGEPRFLDVICPSTEEPAATIAMGCAADVDAAVRAARPDGRRWANTLAQGE